MKYIKDLRSGNRISGIYLCKYKQGAVTKAGKSYENVLLMDKTGVLNGKIWEPNSPAICDFDALDYIDVVGEITSYNGALQISIQRARIASEGEYDPKDYLPCTEKDQRSMYLELCGIIDTVQNAWLKILLEAFFKEDRAFEKNFFISSAAKSVHHGFIGGLLEHTLAVTRLCDYFAAYYPVLNRDLLIASAMLHDIGKTKELSSFPANDYTDEGQMLGHIMIGAEMVHDKTKEIPGFPEELEMLLKHCILSHHGELEYGSPKKPVIIEALALNLADNADAKIETMKELMRDAADSENMWLGYNKLFASNLRKTGDI